MRAVVASTAALLCLSGAAYGADDLATPGAGAFDWSGWYLGGQAGFGHGDFAVDDGSTSPLFAPEWDVSGAYGGLHAGYNQQSGMFVYGVAADINWSGIDGGTSDISQVGVADNSVDGSLDWFGSVRGRLGVAQDRWHVFGTAGWAWGGAEHGQTAAFVPAPRGAKDFHVDGFTGGAGIEYAFTDNWVASLEYRYYHFGTSWLDMPGSYTDRDATLDNLHTIQAGISYKF